MQLTPSGSRYKLVTAYGYRDVTIPKGYETDGISYKFRLIGVIINRFDPRYIEAVVVHDWLTDEGDWDRANRYFEEMLPKGWVSRLMITGVKLYRRVRGL